MATSKFDFNWANDYLELRISREGSPSGFMPELVRWDPEHNYCWVLCYWAKTSEGYELQFVGDRPFVDIESYDLVTVWNALKAMDTALKGYFELEQLNED